MKVDFLKKTAFFMALCAAFFSCKKNDGKAGEEVFVKTITAKKSLHKSDLETFGTVTYGKKTDVTALVDGTIFELLVADGDKVKKGDVLLRMQNVQYEIQRTECENLLDSARDRVEAAKASLQSQVLSVQSRIMSLENSRLNLSQKEKDFFLTQKNLEKDERLFKAGGLSKKNYEKTKMEADNARTEIEILKKQIQMEELGLRDQDLIDDGVTPSAVLEQKIAQLVLLNTKTARLEVEIAQTDFKNAEKKLESINKVLGNLTVTASDNGIIGALNFQNGEHVAANEKLLTIVNMEEPYALVSVQENDLHKISLASPSKVTLSSLEQTQDGRVDFISPLSDPETGNFSVKIRLKNADEKIKLGMFVTCKIQGTESEFFKMPESVLLKRNGQNINFFLVKNGVLLKKECPVKMEDDGFFFLDEGIVEGEKIVENPSASLKEGCHVKTI